MREYHQERGVTIYHGDSREIAPTLGLGFGVVSDPCYGMDWDTDSTRFSGGQAPNNREKQQQRGVVVGVNDWGAIAGDSEPFDPAPWLSYPHVVLFGANHFAQRLPVGTLLVWIKRADHLFGSFLSDAEVAWRKGGHGVYCFRKQFPASSRMQEAGGSCAHPTQKPVSLMRWAIGRSGAPESMPILDPFMGSGTTLVAARELGRSVVGIELEERYCERAARRLSQAAFDFGGAA